MEYPIIVDWIPKSSKVIDLGCGDGTLLSLLGEKEVRGEGVDISITGIEAAKKKNLKVMQGRIDVPLKYEDKSFDFAICSVTLQMVMYPEILISEMKRIADRQIISFPNFAFILNRLELLLRGRMPKFMISGYNWYSTGHIHQLSVLDFQDFAQIHDLEIIKNKYFLPKPIPNLLKNGLKLFPNLFATTALFLTKSKK